MANTSFQSQAIEALIDRTDPEKKTEFDPRLIEFVDREGRQIPVFLKGTESKIFSRMGHTSIAVYGLTGPSLIDRLKDPREKMDGIGIRNTYLGVLLIQNSIELLEVPIDPETEKHIETPVFLMASGLTEQILQSPYAAQDRLRRLPAGSF